MLVSACIPALGPTAACCGVSCPWEDGKMLVGCFGECIYWEFKKATRVVMMGGEEWKGIENRVA